MAEPSTLQAKIAIVGAGWWTTFAHIPALLEHPDAALVALCDLNEAKLQAAGDAFPIPQTYTDLVDMLAQEALDGVVVATDHASHYAVVRACLEANKHVMVEKPMTLFAWQAKALIDCALYVLVGSVRTLSWQR